MKFQNFIVEVIKTDCDETYIIRSPNGQPLKICKSADDIAVFFNELKFND